MYVVQKCVPYNVIFFVYFMHVQEIAVIHKVPRTANVIARENIEVLVVDPPTCFRIFPEEINREYNLTLENMRYMDYMYIYKTSCELM